MLVSQPQREKHTEPRSMTMKIRLPLCQWLRLHLAAVLWAALLLPALAQTSLTNGLVAYYPFNGNANDASGNALNPASVTAALTADRLASGNSAYRFLGQTEEINFTRSPLPQLTNFTVSFWVSPKSLFQNGVFVQVGFDDGTSSANPLNVGLAIGIADNSSSFSSGDELVLIATGQGVYPTGVKFTSTNQWRMISVSYVASNMTVYADGQLQRSLTVPVIRDPTQMFFGWSGAIRHVHADVDAIRIYNRVLTPNEVAQLYASSEVPPVIATQPQSLVAAVGGNATFTVTVTDTNGVSYQWRKEGSPIAGATNDFLTLSNIQPADAGSYDVTVGNALGVTTSSSASLSIVGAPTITTQPLSRTVTQGGTFNFSVGIATSATLPLRYQWRYNGSDIPGAINPVFTLANAQPSAAGLYSVLVANSLGTILSAEAALFVNSPPMVVTHPTNQSVTLGSNVTFTVVASGGTPLTYQWRVNEAPIPGANNQSLTVTGAQLSSAGIYAVLVSDGTFSVFSSSAVLTVLPPFAITPQPVGKATNVGGSATFTVGAVGLGTFNGPFTYQWTFNGAPLAGQTAPSLAFTGLALVNSGNYACVVDSPLGSITSSSALLTVFNPFSVGATSFQPGGLFQMTASGDDGRAYRLESSTNLVIWTAVVTNTVSGGTATFTDSTAAGNVLRFYRIVLLP